MKLWLIVWLLIFHFPFLWNTYIHTSTGLCFCTVPSYMVWQCHTHTFYTHMYFDWIYTGMKMHVYNSRKSKFMQLNYIFYKADLFTVWITFIICKTQKLHSYLLSNICLYKIWSGCDILNFKHEIPIWGIYCLI